MRTSVVSNTGPLVALANAGILGILDRLWEQVLIPAEVRDELASARRLPGELQALLGQIKRLEIGIVSKRSPLLVDVLDRGESAVIELAQERQIHSVLIDERKGRKVAASLFGLNVIGTAGLLLRAKQQGLIPNVRDPIGRMRASGYHIHDRIVSELLRYAHENA